MNDSMAQPRAEIASLELPGWKTGATNVAAVILSILFLASGIWKITYPFVWAVMIAELKFPESLSLAAAIACGTAETVGAVLILVPRFRRWGAMLLGFLLLAFMVYFALRYTELRGAECSCFPWVKRTVGPGFFLGDGLLLLLTALAGLWSRPAQSLRSAVMVLGAVLVYAMVSYGVAAVRQTGVKAPDSISVNSAPYSLQHGKVFLYFFDPQCPHCYKAAQKMSKLDWGSTAVVAIPVSQPRYGPAFLQETGLKAVLTTDLEKLKSVFPYPGIPAGVALENGRQKAALSKFEDDSEPVATLKALGFVH